MAKDESTTTTKAAPAKATAPKAAEPAKAAEKDTAGPRVSTCVVNDGRGMHVGDAVNGKVCSYHAVNHRADGTPR